MLLDIMAGLGHNVLILGRNVGFTPLLLIGPDGKQGLIKEKITRLCYPLDQVREYHTLKYLKPSNFELTDLPLFAYDGHLPHLNDRMVQYSKECDVIFTAQGAYFQLGNDIDMPTKKIEDKMFTYVHSLTHIYSETSRPTRMPHVLACNSRHTQHMIEQQWGLDAQVLYPPIYCDMYDHGKSYDERDIDLLLFHRIDKWKLSFLEQILEKLKSARIVVMGSDCGFRPSPGVETVINPKFHVVRDYLSRSKLFMSMRGIESPPEHFGITTIEAAASGVVPIVHDSGGSREIVEKGRNGFTYESPTEAVSIVKLVLQDRKKWSKFSNMAVERSRDFDASTLQNQIIPLLSSF